MAEKNAASEQRRAEGLIRDLVDLVPPRRELPKLKREEPKGGIPSRRGYAERNRQTGQSAGAGIAGPLQELDINQREYYAPLMSSDGLIALPQVKMRQMTDGNGNPFQLVYADPHPPEPEP